MAKKPSTSTQATAASRTADYTIQGFLYQFNKTLLSIIEASDDTEIVIEGLIEDIDIHGPLHTTAIQCKYHEGQDNFRLSLLYKPILQMMNHFCGHLSLPINYKIYCYCPDKISAGTLRINEQEASAILNSRNKELASLIAGVKGVINLAAFIERFHIEFGVELAELVALVHVRFLDHGFDSEETPILIYPNAIHSIAMLSIDHDEGHRRVGRAGFLATLRTIRKTAISRWTLSLKAKDQLLKAKRKELKPNIAKNVRKRTFILSPENLEDFDDGIVIFISDFLDKCHSKPAHTETPTFCLDCNDQMFSSIRRRIYEKGIIANDGLVGTDYVRGRFTRLPMVTRTQGQVKREFSIRLLRYDVDPEVLNVPKCDDLVVISPKRYPQPRITDVNEEQLATESLLQAKYLLGVSDVYE